MERKSHMALLLSGILLAVAASPAVAQSVAPAGAAAQSAEETEGTGLSDIVVTAQRRSENMQRVPIAVTALDANALTNANVTSTADLTFAVPGVIFQQHLAGAAPFIRGIGNKNGAPGDEGAVGLYVDGVYYASIFGGIFALNNVERIEILKGPQGTLFGRNSAGGVIQIVTRDPKQELSADVSLSYQSYDRVENSAYLTGGLTPTISADLAVYYMNQNKGWGRNLTTGTEIFKGREFSLRSKWLWEPTEGTKIRLTGEYSTATPVVPPLFRPPEGGKLQGNSPYVGFYNVQNNLDTIIKSKSYGGNLQIEQDIGFALLKSISSYRAVNVDYPFDQDGTPVALTDLLLTQRSRTWTQELQLVSQDSGPIQWILGAYYFRDRSSYDPLTARAGATTLFSRFSTLRTKSYAGFAQVTAEVVTDLKLTGGLRYTSDRRSLAAFDVRGTGALVTYPFQAATDNKLTYRAAIDYQATSTTLLYASASRGFKSGLFNTTTPLNTRVLPETLDAYEVGFKSELFDRHVRFNAAAFLYNFKGIQLSTPVPGGSFITNAAKARTKGFEADVQAVPFRNFQIGGSIQYLDSHYRDFANAPGYLPQPDGRNLPIVYANLAGRRTLQAPKWVYNLNASYVIKSEIGDFTLNSSYYHNGGYFYDFENRTRQRAYSIVNAGITWESQNKFLSLRLWANNLTDERYLTTITPQNFGDDTTPAEPRTYGITARIKWN